MNGWMELNQDHFPENFPEIINKWNMKDYKHKLYRVAQKEYKFDH